MLWRLECALWKLQSRLNPIGCSISPKREIYMAVMLTCVLMWLGRWVISKAICSSFQISQIKVIPYMYYSPTTTTTGCHLGLESSWLQLPYCLLGVYMHRFAPSSSFAFVQCTYLNPTWSIMVFAMFSSEIPGTGNWPHILHRVSMAKALDNLKWIIFPDNISIVFLWGF